MLILTTAAPIGWHLPPAATGSKHCLLLVDASHAHGRHRHIIVQPEPEVRQQCNASQHSKQLQAGAHRAAAHVWVGARRWRGGLDWGSAARCCRVGATRRVSPVDSGATGCMAQTSCTVRGMACSRRLHGRCSSRRRESGGGRRQRGASVHQRAAEAAAIPNACKRCLRGAGCLTAGLRRDWPFPNRGRSADS